MLQLAAKIPDEEAFVESAEADVDRVVAYVGGADATDVQAIVECLDRRVYALTDEERAQNHARLLARLEAEQAEREEAAQERARVIAGLAPLAAQCEADHRRHQAEAAQADAREWAEHGVSWDAFPGARFLYRALDGRDQVPDDLLAAWHRLMATPTELLRRRVRELPPESVLEDLRIVEQHLAAVGWRFLDGYGPIWQVLRAVLWHRGTTLAAPAPKTPAARKAAQRDHDRVQVEGIFHDECCACGGTRADDVDPVECFHLHHPLLDGGGVHRQADTDRLRRQIIAYYEEHGEPPPGIEQVCRPCHQHQSQAVRAGCPWGDRIDLRTGDLYDGEDWPEGWVYTRPVPAPARSRTQ